MSASEEDELKETWLLQEQPIPSIDDNPDKTLLFPMGRRSESKGDSRVHFSGADDFDRAELVAGRYELLERIGEGGMGEVWIALQREPVERRVALKLIKQGLASKKVLARFEIERQALALMDHPNIARILDGGETNRGQPFFVMELVQGEHITEFCDRRGLSVRERLQLFLQVCQGIQHAHHKGTIHRDMKPSNVLVTEVDGHPIAKVIDFGLAKAVDRRGDGHTEYGAVVGTPHYMSPEQADVSNQDIDTRTDIYSLGVVLFELLTGTTPLALSDRGGRSLLDTLRTICEVETVAPSYVLSWRKSATNGNGSLRSPARFKQTREVRRELDWIAMKCLEKDRNRRYDDAGSLVRDVQRFLNGEAVEACPQTLAYRFRTYLRRNKVLVTSTLIVILSLVSGLIASTLAMIEANRQQRLAEDATARVVELHFLRQTEERRQLLESGIADAGESLLAVASAFDTWPNASRQNFATFTRRILEQHPEIHAIEWVPRVKANDRGFVEAAARQDGLEGFHFREVAANGETQPVKERDVYFPVLYYEPAEANQAASGLDLASSPSRWRAMQAAIESGKPSASGPIRLVQEVGGQYGFLMFLPLFEGPMATAEQRLHSLIGFAVVVFRTGDLVNRVLPSSGSQSMELVITDLDAENPAMEIYHQSNRTSFVSIRCARHEILVGGRRWLLTFRGGDE